MDKIFDIRDKAKEKKFPLRVFKAQIAIEFDNLEQYIITLEESLLAQQEEFNRQVMLLESNINADYQEEFYELHAGEHWQLTDVFPHLLRTSVFVTSYSMFEHYLVLLCELVSEHKEIKNPHFGNAIIKNAMRYLQTNVALNLPADMGAWEKIISFNELRNIVVHRSGKMDNFSKERLRGFLVDMPSITFDQLRRVRFSRDFCPDVIHTMRNFYFKELIPAFPEKLDYTK
jgi:hypothetical protein